MTLSSTRLRWMEAASPARKLTEEAIGRPTAWFSSRRTARTTSMRSPTGLAGVRRAERVRPSIARERGFLVADPGSARERSSSTIMTYDNGRQYRPVESDCRHPGRLIHQLVVSQGLPARCAADGIARAALDPRSATPNRRGFANAQACDQPGPELGAVAVGDGGHQRLYL